MTANITFDTEPALLGSIPRYGHYLWTSVGFFVRNHANIFSASISRTGLDEPSNIKTKNAEEYMSKPTLGEFIKERRRFLELSQRTLAQKIGLKAASHLCDVENGYRQLGEDHLPLLAKALEVTMEELQNHDPRAPHAEVDKLIERDPAFIPTLNRMVRMAGELSPHELERRLGQIQPAAPETPQPPKSPPTGPP